MQAAIMPAVNPVQIVVNALLSSHLYTKENGGIACSNVIIAAIRTAIPREIITLLNSSVFIPP